MAAAAAMGVFESMAAPGPQILYPPTCPGCTAAVCVCAHTPFPRAHV